MFWIGCFFILGFLLFFCRNVLVFTNWKLTLHTAFKRASIFCSFFFVLLIYTWIFLWFGRLVYFLWFRLIICWLIDLLLYLDDGYLVICFFNSILYMLGLVTWTSCTSFYMYACFHFLGYIPGNQITESYGNSMFYFLRNCQHVFMAALSSTFPLAVWENSNFSTSSLTFIIWGFFVCYSHPSWWTWYFIVVFVVNDFFFFNWETVFFYRVKSFFNPAVEGATQFQVKLLLSV